jgi:hypothetical protein
MRTGEGLIVVLFLSEAKWVFLGWFWGERESRSLLCIADLRWPLWWVVVVLIVFLISDLWWSLDCTLRLLVLTRLWSRSMTAPVYPLAWGWASELNLGFNGEANFTVDLCLATGELFLLEGDTESLDVFVMTVVFLDFPLSSGEYDWSLPFFILYGDAAADLRNKGFGPPDN